MLKRLLPVVSLIAWSALVIRLVVFKSNIMVRTPWLMLRIAPHTTGRANFVPFRTILPQAFGGGNRLTAGLNLAGNILPFIPIGLLVPMVWRNMKWPDALAVSVAVGCLMEGMELFFRVGVFDVDDILLNAFGVMLGYWVGMKLRSR